MLNLLQECRVTSMSVVKMVNTTFAYAGALFKKPVEFEIIETRKMSYEFKLDNGEEKTYHYWQAILPTGVFVLLFSR